MLLVKIYFSFEVNQYLRTASEIYLTPPRKHRNNGVDQINPLNRVLLKYYFNVQNMFKRVSSGLSILINQVEELM